MGGKSSKSRGRFSSGSGSYGGYNHGYPPASQYPAQPGGYVTQPSHPPQYAPAPSPYGYGDRAPPNKKRLERKFSRIADNYRTLEEVTAALSQAGLESSNLIVGIDLTKSNEWTDRGFGKIQRVGSATSTCWTNITSFAPVIEMAMTIVEESGGQYHVLLIIADGPVTRSVDVDRGQLSPQEQKTIDAIVRASEYPLSIVLVGVGDGPWDMMKEFDDNVPARTFDNFQFVNFTEIMSKKVNETRKQTEFALASLMEIPSQYKATLELGLLGGRTGHAPGRIPFLSPLHSMETTRQPNELVAQAVSKTGQILNMEQDMAQLHHPTMATTLKIHLQLLHMTARLVLFVSPIEKTWHLVVGIRLVANVETTWTCAQFVDGR